jgi:hypothetical protein
MEKTYILLRSNKQQGPFTLAQLAKMDLQPEDLVNVQGGIVGWQYAREIDVLKPYLSDYLASPAPVVNTFTDPVANTSPVSLNAPEESKPSPAEVAQPSKPSIPKVEESTPAVAQTVPKAAGVFARFPEGTELSPSGLELKSTSSTRPESATKPSVIKPAAAHLANATPGTGGSPLKVKTPIRQEPVRTQATSAAPRKKAKPAIVLSSLLALGILAFAVGQFATRSDKNTGGKDESGNTNLSATTTSNDTSLEDNRSVLQQELPFSETSKASIASTPTVDASAGTASADRDEKPSDQQVSVATPDSQQQALSNANEPEVTEVPKPVGKEPVKAGPDLTEQIYLKSNFINNELGEGVYDLNISMDNKSDKLLKTVAVNIFFTDNDGKTLNKQTLYFSNVKPGETIVRPASQHKLATRVRCELGLVSSEGLFYYAN